MIRRPPRSTLDRSSAASDVYKRQMREGVLNNWLKQIGDTVNRGDVVAEIESDKATLELEAPVSYTHLRAHETVLDLVCRLLLEKKKQNMYE